MKKTFLGINNIKNLAPGFHEILPNMDFKPDFIYVEVDALSYPDNDFCTPESLKESRFVLMFDLEQLELITNYIKNLTK